jgi:hypothetical protein
MFANEESEEELDYEEEEACNPTALKKEADWTKVFGDQRLRELIAGSCDYDGQVNLSRVIKKNNRLLRLCRSEHQEYAAVMRDRLRDERTRVWKLLEKLNRRGDAEQKKLEEEQSEWTSASWGPDWGNGCYDDEDDYPSVPTNRVEPTAEEWKKKREDARRIDREVRHFQYANGGRRREWEQKLVEFRRGIFYGLPNGWAARAKDWLPLTLEQFKKVETDDLGPEALPDGWRIGVSPWRNSHFTLAESGWKTPLLQAGSGSTGQQLVDQQFDRRREPEPQRRDAPIIRSNNTSRRRYEVSPVRRSEGWQERPRWETSPARYSGYRPTEREEPRPARIEKSPLRGGSEWRSDVERGNRLADQTLQRAILTIEGLQTTSTGRLPMKMSTNLTEINAAVEAAAVDRQLQLLEEEESRKKHLKKLEEKEKAAEEPTAKKARIPAAILSAEKTASLRMLGRALQTAGTQLGKECPSKANSTEWMNQSGTSGAASGPQSTSRREVLIDQSQGEKKKVEMTLKQKLEAAKKKLAQMCLEEPAKSERLVITRPPEAKEDWTEVAELAISLETSVEVVDEAEGIEKQGPPPMSQWALEATCQHAGCQNIRAEDVIGTSVFDGLPLNSLFQLTLLVGHYQMAARRQYLDWGVVSNILHRMPANLIEEFETRPMFRKATSPIKDENLRWIVHTWLNKCAMARAQMTAAVGIQAPPDKASSPPEFRRMEERWKETIMKSLAKRFSSKDVLFVRKAEMIVFADENDVRTTRKLRIEGLLAVVPFTDQLVIFPETVNTIILWNTEADSSHRRTLLGGSWKKKERSYEGTAWIC